MTYSELIATPGERAAAKLIRIKVKHCPPYYLVLINDVLYCQAHNLKEALTETISLQKLMIEIHDNAFAVPVDIILK